MKSIITLVCLVFCCQFLAAQDGQLKKKICSEYMQFLKEEGFSPTVDEDGDIKFKKEGTTYYINVYDEQSPQYIYFSAPGFQVGGEDGFEKEKAAIAVNAVNKRKRGVKLFLNEKSVSVGVEMPFANTESFKGVFYKLMVYLDAGREGFREEYDKL